MNTMSYTTTSTLSNYSTTMSIQQPLCKMDVQKILLTVGYAIIFTIGTSGNALVLYTVRHYWRRGPIIELLILYLAAFNFFSSLLDPLVYGYFVVTCNMRWDFGWLGCKLLPSICRILSNISIGLILIMAIDRCRAIVFPFRRRLTRRNIHLLCAGNMLLASLSEVHHINGSYLNDNGLCRIVNVYKPTYLYPSVITIGGRILTIVFIQFSTTLIAHLKLKSAKNKKLLKGAISNKRCKKVTQMLVVMATVFSVSVMPRDFFHLIYTLSWSDKDGIISTPTIKLTNQLLKLLQTSNVIYNVFIYARMHETFRRNKSVCFHGKKLWKVFSRKNNRGIHARLTATKTNVELTEV